MTSGATPTLLVWAHNRRSVKCIPVEENRLIRTDGQSSRKLNKPVAMQSATNMEIIWDLLTLISTMVHFTNFTSNQYLILHQ